MKQVWRQDEKSLYFPKGVQRINIPKMTFLTLAGVGDPNAEAFGQQIQALYSLSYALRMPLKQSGFTYTVYPLEGVWTTLDGSRDETLNKAALAYQIMIRQPAVVTQTLFAEALAHTLKKKPNPYLNAVQRVEYTEGSAIQMLHVGPFATEGETFAQMQAVMTANGLHKQTTMGDFQHREVYLSDFRRVAPEKRKTLLRWRLA